VCGRRHHRVRDRTCPPWLSGRYPASSLVWGHPTSDAPSGLLPVCRLYRPTPDWRSASDLPSSQPCPVDVPRSSTPVGSWEPWPLAPWMWPSLLLSRSAPTSLFMTGLNPFTLAHGGPSPPCVRFAAVVAFGHATLGIRCLARASGAGTCPRLTRPSFARRTSNGAKNRVKASSLLNRFSILLKNTRNTRHMDERHLAPLCVTVTVRLRSHRKRPLKCHGDQHTTFYASRCMHDHYD